LYPYWILFSVYAIGALQFRSDFQRPIAGGPLFAAAAVLTALMIGLRYEVGADWPTYVEILQEIGDADFLKGVFSQDPGYGLINWLIARAGFDIWAVNLVCGACFTWGLVKLARRQPNPWLTILIGVPYLVIVVAMGYTRQAVAIGFLLALISELEGGSLLRLALYALLAAAFHKSSVAVLPIIALTATRGRLLTSLVILLALPILYYAFLQASVDVLTTNYVEAEYNSQGAAVRVAMNTPPALIFLLFKRRFRLSPTAEKLWRNFAYAGILALVMLIYSPSSTAVDRLALYIIPLQLIVLSRLPWAFPDRGGENKLLIVAIIAYSGAIQFTWLTFATHAGYWVPYRIYPF
jgi:hypothetical protein